MKTLRCWHIIHIFAIIHAVIVLLCGAFNVADEFILTVATVSMIAIIGVRNGQGLGIIAACVIAGNILGFMIGTYGAVLLSNILPAWLLHATTSFITTELLGFGLLLIFNSMGGGERELNSNRWVPNLLPMILMLVVLLAVRVIYSKIFGDMLSDEVVSLSLKLLLSNSLAIITLICCNVIYLIISQRSEWLSTPVGYIVGIISEAVVIATITSIIIGYNLPFGTDIAFYKASFIQRFGAFRRSPDANCRERFPYTRKERTFFGKSTTIGYYRKGVHLQFIVVVESQRLVAYYPAIKLKSTLVKTIS